MVWTRFKRRIFPLEITKRIYIWTVMLLIISHTLLSIGIFQQIIKFQEHENYEQAILAVGQLNRDLYVAARNIDSIILQSPGDNRTNADKYQLVNTTLEPIIARSAEQFPGFSSGYYFSEFDGLIGSVPSDVKHPLTPYLRSVEPDYSHTPQYQKNTIQLSDTKVHIVSYPVELNGQVVGLVWSYFPDSRIYYQALPEAAQVFFIGIMLSALVVMFQWFMSTRLKRGMEGFAQAVLQEDDNFPAGILPELTPVLQQVKTRASELRQLNTELQREIHERQEADQRYETLASIVESTNDAVIGTVAGVITSWNKSSERMFGYSAAEVIGQPMSLVVPIHPPDEQWTGDREISAGETFDHYETVSRRKDGTPINVSFSISQIIDYQGQSMGTSIIARDITERKKMERDLSRLDRLNLVGQMAAGIGHEIRNPMTTVRGFLQLLGSKEDLTAYQEYFNIMISELDRANAIISEFLSMARNKVIELSVGNLNDTIKAIFPLIEASGALAGKTVELQLSEIPNLLLNEKEIRQVILNLARNGLEAMDQGKLTLKTYCEGNQVVLAVQDQGTGISPESLGKIGTPFFTTKDKGTGLGLAVCYSIATRHQANIDVESSKAGTTFFVRFRIPPSPENHEQTSYLSNSDLGIPES